MNSDLSPTKSSKATGSPYFKSLEPLSISQPNAENGDPNIPVGITFYISVLMGDQIIMFGKPNDQIKTSTTLWTFNLQNLKWEPMEVEGSSFLVEKKADYSACVIENSYVLLFGCTAVLNSGNHYNSSSNKGMLEFLIPTNSGGKKWVPKQTQDMPVKSFHSASYYRKKMYIFGGINANNYATNTLFKYSLSASTFHSQFSLIIFIRSWNMERADFQRLLNQYFLYSDSSYNTSKAERYKHKSVIFKNSLFIFGGIDADANPINKIAMINLKTRQAQILAPNPANIYGGLLSSVISLPNKILVFGGRSKGSEGSYVTFVDQSLNGLKSFQVQDLKLEEGSGSVYFFNDEFIIQNKSDFSKLRLNLDLIEEQGNETSELSHHMKNLFLDNNYFDVKFKVEDKEIPAYKGILIARCPYFAKMFSSGMKESQEQIIEVPEIKYEVYEKLIEYLYCDDIEIDKDTAIPLLKLSEEYSLPGLKAKCARNLARILNQENFLEFADLANTFQVKQLQDAVVEYFVCFRQSILNSFKIQDLPRYLLEEYIVKYVNE